MSLHWDSVPLDGRVLVEASAGTGKTWTIAMLYLRLLLEAGQPPEAIVVTTFTDAAAQELRGRIRRRLREALAVLDGAAGNDPALTDYLAQRSEPPARLGQRLRLALLDLDRAPIGTLHSLCMRVLREFPLHTGSDALGLEQVDEAALRRALIDDLWRQLTQTEQDPLPFTGQLLRDGRDWLQRSLPGLLQPGLVLREPDPAALADCALLEDAAPAPALRALSEDDSLYTRKNAKLRGELHNLADLLQFGEPQKPGSKPTWDNLGAALADPSVLDNQLTATARVRLADDPDFQFALRAGAIIKPAKRLLRGAALAWCRQRFLALRLQRLARSRAIGYDDMIERVHQAVGSPGNPLAELLHARWKVALIDEFQDTDTRQYAIFDRLFRSADRTIRGCLMLVGDPKQAIYRFRGGDIHTYQRAAADCDARISLDTNHRSSRELVAALNTLYARGGDGFRIAPGPGHFGYVAVKASGRRDQAPWQEAGRQLDVPLELHVLHKDDDPAAAPQRVELAIESCAALIADTLAGGQVQIDGAPLHPGQIAVLLPRHQDIAAMREALRRRGIACSGASRSDVFSTDWARALQLQLWAWLNPDDPDALRAVLRSPLYGWPLAALHPAVQDAGLLAAAQQANALQAERWRRAGVLGALGALIDSRCEDLLREPTAGERAITDLRHLGELLATAEADGQRGEALWHWLAAQREQPETDSDARQLRIESDGRRIRLMTLHGSKGLEFEWVLLPLMWNHAPREPEWPVTHDGQGRRVLDLGSPGYAAAQAEALGEAQREHLRVLYVALTRAVHRLDVWAMDPERRADARRKGAQDEARRSGLDLLLAPLFATGAPGALPGIAWQSGWPMADASLQAEDQGIALPPWPALPAPPVLQSLVSFSSLTHSPRSETRQAEDEVETTPDMVLSPSEPHPTLLAWEPLRGTAVGNALHAILERRATWRPLAEQHSLISSCLAEFGWERGLRGPAMVEQVAQRLDAVLESDLGDGLCLARLGARAQRVEMDFRLRLDGVSLAQLKQVLQTHDQPGLLPASIMLRKLNGLLSGKIDLVFDFADRLHVLDYKSNRLGLSEDDYHGAALERAMGHSGYRFQALLYTLAVHRYLRGRRRDYQPDRHLGESWYLFLRGVGLAPGLGVWRHRFTPALVEAVDEVFAGSAA